MFVPKLIGCLVVCSPQHKLPRDAPVHVPVCMRSCGWVRVCRCMPLCMRLYARACSHARAQLHVCAFVDACMWGTRTCACVRAMIHVLQVQKGASVHQHLCVWVHHGHVFWPCSLGQARVCVHQCFGLRVHLRVGVLCDGACVRWLADWLVTRADCTRRRAHVCVRACVRGASGKATDCMQTFNGYVGACWPSCRLHARVQFVHA